MKKGFTLIELLIVIAIIAIVASVIFVALDPISRFRDARNAQRWQDVEAVGDAVRIYQIDNKGQVPPGVDENWKMLGTDALGCDIACGVTGEISDSYLHSNQGDFNTGAYSNTQWDNANEWVELIAGSSGTYTSPVIDAGASNTWATLAWKPSRPTYKALPGSSETAYSTGNVNMSNSVLLYHFDELSGAIMDSSGNGNSGYNSGATYGATGKFNTAMDFDGVNDRLFVEGGNTADFTDDFTISFWVYIDDQVGDWPLKYIIDNFTGGNPGRGYLVYYAQETSQLRFSVRRDNPTLYEEEIKADQKSLVYVIDKKRWVHATVVFSGDSMSMYVDGESVVSLDLPDNYPLYQYPGEVVFGGTQSLAPLQDRYCFNGKLDEVAFWDRVLSPSEILDQYKRGALRLNLQVRSCDDAVCAGESFIGPDGTAGTYYNELNNSTTGLPSFNLANVTDSQYFQYQTSFATDNALYSPELSSVTIETMVAGEGGDTLQSSCLDLTSTLATKLPTVPEDPSDGSQEKTYYALQRDDTGQINVQACSAEGETIKISR